MAKRRKSRNAEEDSGSEGGRRRGGRRGKGGNKPSYRQRIRERRIAANKKSGCVPKLVMLLLPFVAVGAYLFLNA